MRTFVFEDKTGVSARQSSKLYEHDLLSDTDVATLAAQYQQNGNIAARNRIVLHFQKLVKRVARPYLKKSPGHSDDILGAGRLGLFRALEDFNPNIHPKFETHAWNWVRAFITEEISKNWDTVPVSRKSIARMRSQGRSEPKYCVAIDAGSADSEATSVDPLAVRGIFHQPSEENHELEWNELYARYGHVLSRRQREVIDALLSGMELSEISNKWGMSRQGVEQLRNVAIGKLRKAIGAMQPQ